MVLKGADRELFHSADGEIKKDRLLHPSVRGPSAVLVFGRGCYAQFAAIECGHGSFDSIGVVGVSQEIVVSERRLDPRTKGCL